MTTSVTSGVKVDFRGVSKVFGDRKKGAPPVEVLKGVDLAVRENEIVCVLGPSGCGKSTLLNCAAGLESYDGSIVINDREVREPLPELAVVFQAPHLLPWRNVRKNTQYGLEMRRTVPKGDWPGRVKDAIRLVGLDHAVDRFPRQLSGGMQQRVNIARALAVGPEVLLMDEPFGALDALTKERMQEELQRIVAGSQLTVVFITHDIGEAIYLGDRIVVMSSNPGQIRLSVEVDAPRPRGIEFKRSSGFQEIYSTLWNALA
ncbi:ABC transporter ATP-binding protein [Amycolatopsis acidicola]|nr:ABC transporter ATP-binding protein [Amycolatopsis acidicola]